MSFFGPKRRQPVFLRRLECPLALMVVPFDFDMVEIPSPCAEQLVLLQPEKRRIHRIMAAKESKHTFKSDLVLSLMKLLINFIQNAKIPKQRKRPRKMI